MPENLFGFFGLLENPFTLNPNPRYMVLTSWAQEALAQISCGIRDRKGLMVFTGEAGTGKTILIHSILDSLHQQGTPTAFIFNSRFKVSDLFALILAEFGIPSLSEPDSSSPECIYQWLIDRYRAGETPVLIVDEAQGLSKSVLKEINRLLSFESTGEKLLQIVLAGHPELEEMLKRPQLHELRKRISCHCKTARLNLEQTHQYIGERLRIAGAHGGEIFIREAIDAIHFYSEGIPRVVNLLCEHALINAYADELRPVPMDIVKEVATEFRLGGVEPFSPVHISHSSLRAGLPTILTTNVQQAIDSPATSKGMLGVSWAVAPPEGKPLVLSLNIAEGEEEPIAPISKNVDEACDVAEAVRTPSTKPEAIPVPSASCIEVGSQKGHHVLPVPVGDEVTPPLEHTFHPRMPSVTEPCVRWARRISVLPAFRLFGSRLLHWRDQLLPLVRSIAWRRVAVLLSAWLREPIGKTYWRRVKLLRFPHFCLQQWTSVLPALRSFGRWLSQWRYQRLPFFESIPWALLAARLLLWLREPIGKNFGRQINPQRFLHFSVQKWKSGLPMFRSLGCRLSAWRDQRLPFFGSIPWRRLVAFVLLWLEKPVGTVHWCQVHPQGFLLAKPLQRPSLPRK